VAHVVEYLHEAMYSKPSYFQKISFHHHLNTTALQTKLPAMKPYLNHNKIVPNSDSLQMILELNK
jgi:hypothetical protein